MILTARRSPALLFCDFGHPRRRTSTAALPAAGEPFQAENRFLNLLAFLAERKENFCYIHRFKAIPLLCFLSRIRVKADRQQLH